MDKHMEAQEKMIEAMGLNEKMFGSCNKRGDRRWVILHVSDHVVLGKSFGIMVTRDGVEPPPSLFRAALYQQILSWKSRPGVI
jgi:hypothetical protein